MDVKKLNELIQKGECEFLDFKKEFTGHNSDLIHDILCLANARTESTQDRYLIYGVDDDRNIVGLDSKFPLISHITNYLRKKVNKMPKLDLKKFKIRKRIVVVLIIKDLPHKPYCLIADYSDEKEPKKLKSDRVIRAGVVYERENDNNTSVKACADFDNVKWMYRQQFEAESVGVYEELLNELRDPTRWKLIKKNKLFQFINIRKSYFTIDQAKIKHLARKNRILFTSVFLDHSAIEYEYEFRCNSKMIKSEKVLSCAGGELLVVRPNSKLVGQQMTDRDTRFTSFYYIKHSCAHLFEKLLRHHFPKESDPGSTYNHSLDIFNKIVAEFDSENDAINKLERDYKSPKRKYTYFKQVKASCTIKKPNATDIVAWENRASTVDNRMH